MTFLGEGNIKPDMGEINLAYFFTINFCGNCEKHLGFIKAGNF
jgi:hypothetical protein